MLARFQIQHISGVTHKMMTGSQSSSYAALGMTIIQYSYKVSTKRKFLVETYTVMVLSILGLELRGKVWKIKEFLPGSSHYHSLGPGLHDLRERAIVKKSTQPLTFLSYRMKEKENKECEDSQFIEHALEKTKLSLDLEDYLRGSLLFWTIL